MTTCDHFPTSSSASSARPAPTPSTSTRSLAPLPSVTNPDGWVVYSRTTIPGIGRVVTEKRDGATRSRQIGR